MTRAAQRQKNKTTVTASVSAAPVAPTTERAPSASKQRPLNADRREHLEHDDDNDNDHDGDVDDNEEDQKDDEVEIEAHADADDDTDAADAVVNPLDLTIRVFVGTYTGTLYGIETIQTVREMIQTKTEEQQQQQHQQEEEEEEEEDEDEDVKDKDEAEQVDAQGRQESHRDDVSDTSSIPAVPTFLTLFSTEAHRSAIHALSVSPDAAWLISSGPDEIIQLYSLSLLRHHGSLHRHYSTITTLSFCTPSTFCSASEEGIIGIWSSASQWEMIGRLRGHTGAINGISIHHTAKVMLSISSQDNTIRMWDLVNGRLATTRHIEKEDKRIIEGGTGYTHHQQMSVVWCQSFSHPSDLHYVLLRDTSISLYDEKGQLYRKMMNPTPYNKMLSVVFLPSLLLCGYDNGTIHIYAVHDGQLLLSNQIHKARVRCMVYKCIPSEDDEKDHEKDVHLVCTADTQGQIHLWHLNPLLELLSSSSASTASSVFPLSSSSAVFVPIASAKSEARITALCMGLRYEPYLQQRLIQQNAAQPSQSAHLIQTSSSTTSSSLPKTKPVPTGEKRDSKQLSNGKAKQKSSSAVSAAATLIQEQHSSTQSKSIINIDQKLKNPNKAQRKKLKRMQLQQQRGGGTEQQQQQHRPSNRQQRTSTSRERDGSLTRMNKKRRVLQQQ